MPVGALFLLEIHMSLPGRDTLALAVLYFALCSLAQMQVQGGLSWRSRFSCPRTPQDDGYIDSEDSHHHPECNHADSFVIVRTTPKPLSCSTFTFAWPYATRQIGAPLLNAARRPST